MYIHFDLQLKEMGSCPNRRCNCVDVLADGYIPATVVRYSCWFKVKTKYEQDSIEFEWFMYPALRKSVVNVHKYWFCLPYISDGATDVVLDAVRKHVVCYRGLLLILDFGARRWQAIRNASTVSGVFPQHKRIGKINYNSIRLDETRFIVPLTRQW